MSKNMLGIAIALVAEAFKNKVDKQGKPYILHCLHVMNEVNDEDKIPAVLHDYVEDCFKDYEQGFSYLRELGFNEADIACVDILTHRKNVDYIHNYIRIIGHYPRATRIKLKDLEHNSNISRLKGLTKADFDRMEKYHTAYTYLSKI